MAHPDRAARAGARQRARAQRRCELTVVLVAAAIFLTGILSPPSPMDDVDSVQAHSAVFYAGREVPLLNGRVSNLEYRSCAPNAPRAFIGDADPGRLWRSPATRYPVVEDKVIPRIEAMAGGASLHLVRASGGKSLFSNREPAVAARARRF